MLKINMSNNNIKLENEIIRILKTKGIKKYILGKNNLAAEISTIIETEGFIDEYTDEISFCEKGIYKIDEICEDAFVISASNLRSVTAIKKLKDKKIACIDSFMLNHILGFKLKSLEYFEYARKDVIENIKKYEYLYGLLKDDESKKTLNSLLNFRYSSNLNFMQEFTYRIEEQYFEEFIKFSDDEVFLDVGGFDGFTSLEFIKKCKNYRKIFIFEPDVINMKRVKSNTKKYSDIEYLCLGASSKKMTLKFDLRSNSSSRISEDGTVGIKVDLIDNLIQDVITFIKMDIEGEEIEAIKGAQLQISRNHPKLAISVYHKVEDLWKIPQLILSIRDDYDIYLRHYTEGIDETVMFFVPNKY